MYVLGMYLVCTWYVLGMYLARGLGLFIIGGLVMMLGDGRCEGVCVCRFFCIYIYI